MIVYVIYFIFLMILAVEYELRPLKNNGLYIFIVLALGLLAGLRGPEVSKDYQNYQVIFDFVDDLSGDMSGGILPVFEPGFMLLIKFVRLIVKENYGVVLMLFFALTSVSLKVNFIRKVAINPFMVILFYYSQFFLLHEMTQIRIGFASALFFLSLIYYFRDQKLYFILLILGATFFHYSAILYLGVLLFHQERFNKYLYLGFIAAAFVFGILQIPLLNYAGSLNVEDVSNKLNTYAELVELGIQEGINVFNILNLINIAVCLYYLLVVPVKQILKDKVLLLFLKCNILSIFLLSFLSGIPSIAFRFSELFGISSMFVLAYLVKYLPFKKWNILFVIIIAGVYFYINAFHSQLLNPYYFIDFK